jgi:arylsulfatase A-like enzyme
MVDTLRADRLGAYGYTRGTSPRIDEFATESALFESAISAAPWTLPSVASLMTSTHSFEHGAGRRLRAGPAVQSPGFYSKVRSTGLTLAEVLSARGYATYAIVSNVYLTDVFGLHQGFTDVDYAEREAAETTRRASTWLGTSHAAPFFLFVHYIDPHKDYDPPKPFDTRFFAPGNRVPRYDGEIAFADEQIGKLLDEIARLGLESETLVVFTADHGEALWDHGYNGHGLTLYDEELRVPLIIRYGNRFEPRRIEQSVSLLDVMPTILEILEIPIPDAARGESLVPLLQGHRIRDRLLFSEDVEEAYAANLEFDAETQHALRGEYKYIFSPNSGRRELYDLDADPAERTNLASEYPARTNAYHDELLEILARKAQAERASPDQPIELDEETRRRLRELGYSE